MIVRTPAILLLLFFFCNNVQAKAPSDTTSIDYLIYLLKNEKDLNGYWANKLEKLDICAFPLDSMSHLSIEKDWKINDSVSVILLVYSTGTSYDTWLLTVKNKRDFISQLQIGDQADSDLGPGRAYYYTEYKLLSNRQVKLFHHKVTGSDGDENDKLMFVHIYTVQNSGKVVLVKPKK